MTTQYALAQAAFVANDLEAKGFLSGLGKAAAGIVIFFIAIGLIIGLLIGFFVGRAVGRRQSAGHAPAQSPEHHDQQL